MLRRGTVVLAFAGWTLAVCSAKGLGHADADALLGTSGRSDLVGPEVWTCTFTGAGGGSAAADLRAARDAWALPRPGLSGRLYVVNETSLGDALVPSVAELTPSNRVPLAFGVVRNRWTPSGMLSYYRSAADRTLGDFPSLGGTVLRERKCITRDNVFVAELTVRNASAHPRRYDLSLVSKLTNGVWRFTTVSRGERKERRTSTAFGANRRMGTVEIPRNGELTFRYGAAFGAEEPSAVLAKLKSALDDAEVFEKNRRHVNGWFAGKVPAFDCGDIDLMRLYYYRWFVVYRALHEARRIVADHEYARLAAYESPCGGWYGCVIGLPVPMQIQEMSWLRDPDPAKAQILGWVEKHPHYTDYIQFTPMTIWRNQLNHPDLALARQAFARVAPEPKGEAALPNQWGSWATGAEYQPNFYQFTEPKWDWRHDCEMQKKGFEVAQLKRLDTAAYAIGNLLGGARIARLVGETDRAAALERRAEEMRRMLLSRHWDDRLGLFLAADPKSGRLADEAACYDTFAPYAWGIVSEPQYFRAFDKLADADWFGADFAIPTVAQNCPMYSPYNAIIGPTEASETKPHLYGCSWNGPVWHYADSLVAMAFGEVARREAKYRKGWLRFFDSWNETHFVFGDRTLMRAAEHFRAEDGVRFGQTADYFHSSWVDPFIRFWCGVGLAEDGKTTVFEPFARVSFSLHNVPVAGTEFDFAQDCRGTRRLLTVRESKSGRVLAKGAGRVEYSVSGKERK